VAAMTGMLSGRSEVPKPPATRARETHGEMMPEK
jgi:hypothetical protein